LSVSLTAFLLAVSFPLIAAYLNNDRIIIVTWDGGGGDWIEPPDPGTKPPPPPPPPPSTNVAEKVKFTAPRVVNDSVEDNSNMFPDDNDNSKNSLPPPIDSIGSSGDDNKVVNSPIDIKPTPFIVVEEMPSFPGGDEARIKFISDNIVYPEIEKEINTQGTIYITFVVETDGSITDVKILRGIGSGCDEEAVRVVKMMPKWNPGKQSGKSVRVQFNLPIKFTLQ
jgi:periplasmic protein TonB